MKKFCLTLVLLVFSSLSLAEQQTWYLVRHFEKQTGPDPSLTETGKKRSVALAAYFADKELQAVYSTNYQRTKQTAQPVADAKKLPVQSYHPADLNAVAKQMAQLNHVLLVGHSNTTPELLYLIGGDKVTITEADYGTLYILRKKDGLYQTEAVDIRLAN